MPDFKRPIWTDLWDIHAASLSCKECQAIQTMAQRDQAFHRHATCSRNGPGQFPYIEILEVLKLMHYGDQPLQPGPLVWTPSSD